jgi:hypothetical protein
MFSQRKTTETKKSPRGQTPFRKPPATASTEPTGMNRHEEKTDFYIMSGINQNAADHNKQQTQKNVKTDLHITLLVTALTPS